MSGTAGGALGGKCAGGATHPSGGGILSGSHRVFEVSDLAKRSARRQQQIESNELYDTACKPTPRDECRCTATPYPGPWWPPTGYRVPVAVLNMSCDGEGQPDTVSNEENARWLSRRPRQFVIANLCVVARLVRLAPRPVAPSISATRPSHDLATLGSLALMPARKDLGE